jgi:hypothetical protein
MGWSAARVECCSSAAAPTDEYAEDCTANRSSHASRNGLLRELEKCCGVERRRDDGGELITESTIDRFGRIKGRDVRLARDAGFQGCCTTFVQCALQICDVLQSIFLNSFKRKRTSQDRQP